MMDGILLLMLLVVAAKCSLNGTQYQAKFRIESTMIKVRPVECSKPVLAKFTSLLKEASCNKPRLMLVNLKSPSNYEIISPRAVMAYRCHGLCYTGDRTEAPTPCLATIRYTKLPVRIYSIRTETVTCATYNLDEHIRCSCTETGVETRSGVVQLEDSPSNSSYASENWLQQTTDFSEL